MNPYEKAKYSDLLTWLRRHRAIWSHIRVRFVALRFADRWNALWTQITMLDGESNDDLLGGPSCQFEDVLAANVVIPITALPRLLRSIRMGHLPAGAISDLSDLHFSWIDGQVPEPDDLRTELSPLEWTPYTRHSFSFCRIIKAYCKTCRQFDQGNDPFRN